MKYIIAMLALVLIASCTPVAEPEAMQCTQHSECETPYTYLARSVCPFSSYCVEGNCEVGCPEIFGPDNDPSHPAQFDPNYTSPAKECDKDSDCSCDYAAGDFKSCRCIDNKCVALVTPII